MKGYEAIAAMERGECVHRGNLTYRMRKPLDILDIWTPKGWSQTSWYGHEMFADGWEVVPDPDKPQEEEKEAPHDVFGRLAAGAFLSEIRKMIREEIRRELKK